MQRHRPGAEVGGAAQVLGGERDATGVPMRIVV